ncbi:MAG: transporter [Pseudomonadota bacterium]
MSAVLVTLIPWFAVVVGAAITAVRRPGPNLTSAIQHFAAGVVFAAAAGEVLPSLKHAGAAVPVAIGGTIGVLVMLGVKQVGERAKGPAALVALIAVDMLIDGLVLGIAFVAGARQGILLTVALTLEVLFLGLAMAVELSGKAISRLRVIGITAAVGLVLPVGALIAQPVSMLPISAVTAFYAFGIVALLYLVTEELLVEAHECPERPWVTAMFFVGFLALFLLEETL